MDIPPAAWSSELEMEELADFMNQYQMGNTYSDMLDSFSSQSSTEYPSLAPMHQTFQEATNYLQGNLAKQPNAFAPNDSSSKTFTISFGNTNSSPEFVPHQLYGGDLNSGPVKLREETSPRGFLGFMDGSRKGASSSRHSAQAQDHVLAERKRREKLTQRFISLSALLPELRKMDKATVLEDATKYIKALETRVKELEQTSGKGKGIIQEAAVTIRRSIFSGANDDDDDASYSDEANSSPSSSSYKFTPEIEARISGSSVLVRIYCHSNSFILTEALTEMERLQLTVISSSMIPFANTALLITISGQMGDKNPMTAVDLVKSLQSAVRRLL